MPLSSPRARRLPVQWGYNYYPISLDSAIRVLTSDCKAASDLPRNFCHQIASLSNVVTLGRLAVSLGCPSLVPLKIHITVVLIRNEIEIAGTAGVELSLRANIRCDKLSLKATLDPDASGYITYTTTPSQMQNLHPCTHLQVCGNVQLDCPTSRKKPL